MNNVKIKSFEEWKKSFPDDYRYAKYKNMLPFILHKMGWELPKNESLERFNDLKERFNDLKETKLVEAYNIFLEIEKEMNTIKIKNNKASKIRFRVRAKELLKTLKKIRRDVSLIK